ncbi:hypothetical protein JHU38_07745 [Prevotella sp. A2931]|uniref:Lipoprotein n=1 Tax=Prevotella illustrans TaxID=2800387 RepID=A0ABS3M6F1_9BACT|nr:MULTISPECIES: hypothetical protein [Prevotella]MBO1363661.1 hypothetical protein [Prevotella illustrans]PTL26803.1 hypothetical protein C3V39_07000 [Prevotella sp. oral taxon 820]
MRLLRIVFYLFAATLCLTTFSGCSGEDSSSETLYPQKVSPEITSFFETHLPVSGNSDCFFKPFKKETDTVEVHIVNSMAELQQLCYAPVELPQIDFSKSILVIGWKEVPNLGYEVDTQKLLVSPTFAELYIATKPLGPCYPAFSHMFFWGFYPKTDVEKVKVHVKLNHQN